MNHPSDYMPDYRDSSSSDSSNHHFCPQTHTYHTSSHKNKSELSLIKPKPKDTLKPHKNKKKTKPTSQKTLPKKKSKQEKERVGKVDILVYDGGFYSCGNIDEISNRFKQKHKSKEDQMLMLEQRLHRKQQRCIQKIQKYLKGFLMAKHTKKHKIGASQKLELYTLLKKEQQEQQDQNLVVQILRKSLQSLEQKCEKLTLRYPTQQETITRWKNIKMHQLMTAQSFLLQENQLNLDIDHLNTELSLLNDEEFFPQMRQQAHQLQLQIINHIESQQSRSSPKLQDRMVVWTINRFLTFVQQREDIWSLIGQGLEQYQYGYKNRPLITHQIFMQFQKHRLDNLQPEEQHQQSNVYLHVFNKAVVDVINQVALESNDFFPAITCFKEITNVAKNKLVQDQLPRWYEGSLLYIGTLIFEQLLEDFLTDILDFL